MSLYGMMRTGVSGMQGQASKLSAVADNIANANTNGYKKQDVEFSTLVVNGSSDTYNSGGVVTTVRKLISEQGVPQYTTSASDLAIDGDGFFVVQDSDGNSFLTRAGSFVPDAEGRLVNAAGYYLVGYSYANGEPSVVVNSYEGLEPVVVNSSDLQASPSTDGVLRSNLPSGDEVSTGTLPSANLVGAEYSEKSSMVVYDDLGDQVILDIYYTKTADNEWEISVFNKADATADTSFPYASGPLATETITFDSTNGHLSGSSPTELVINVPGGRPLTMDLTETTHLASDFLVSDPEVNGNGPETIESVDFSADGTVYAQYSDGTTRALFRIPLATVASPDNLSVLSGNLFQASESSGEVSLTFADSGAAGKIISGALEGSTVDIAEELTAMIQSQRNYTANSKVFQTGSELMDVLLNLKR